MLALDLNKLQQIAESSTELAIRRAFGSGGMDALRRMYIALRDLYSYLELDLVQGQLVVVASIGSHNPHSSSVYREMLLLANDLLPHVRSGSVVVTVGEDGSASWHTNSYDVQSLATQNVVYVYEQERETIFAKNNSKTLTNPSNIHASIFSIPTFKKLENALDDYKRTIVRKSGSMLFRNVWNTDKRLIFCNKPESIMRNSLYEFLFITFRDAVVQMESVVDTSHPVDIMLIWMFTTRVALIEIKWVGKALATGGGTTNYTDARARSGAAQLEAYLDSHAQLTPMHTARGYLVVIDGRRRGVDHNSTQVTRENGMYYADRELTYNIYTSTPRIDFITPIRMFAEPICSPV